MATRGKGKKDLHLVYTDGEATARLAGLRYINDSIPGIRREKEGGSVVYYDPDGAKVDDTETLIRIKSLSIPPAWENVWISPFENSHLQATGTDAKGRKQYRYHPSWMSVRGTAKFGRMLLFGEKLPLIREKVRQHLRMHGMPREKVLAIVVELLDKTFLRIGNVEYERNNKTHGLTTLKNRHVSIDKDEIMFRFRAKSGKESCISIHDRKLAKLVKRCKELPGYHLFSYIDGEGQPREVDSRDVNDYLREISGEYFTAKDFRTWGATVSALQWLRNQNETDEKGVRKTVLSCIRAVAEKLKNTVNVCRKYYIHPKIFDTFTRGKLGDFLKKADLSATTFGSPEEQIFLDILKAKI
jgi:DNA topoisomerase I